MVRATIWTVGLFGAGSALCRLFPGTWTEPIVLFALGLALLFVSARTAPGPARVGAAARPPAAVTQVVPKAPAAPAPLAAAAQVERTA